MAVTPLSLSLLVLIQEFIKENAISETCLIWGCYTYQELYEIAAEVERVKSELRALSPRNQKRKWNDHGTSSESVVQKKHAGSPKSRPATSI